jgi:hypothetical protein
MFAPVITATSRDVARPTLGGVFVEWDVEWDDDARTITTAATDSYRLHTVTIGAEGLPTGDSGTILDGDSVRAMLKGLGTKKSDLGAWVRVETGDSVWTFTRPGAGGGAWFVPVVPGSFPAWRSLLPETGTADGLPAFNPALAASVFDSVTTFAKACGQDPENVHARVTATSALRPSMIQATADSATFTAILMPVRVR